MSQPGQQYGWVPYPTSSQPGQPPAPPLPAPTNAPPNATYVVAGICAGIGFGLDTVHPLTYLIKHWLKSNVDYTTLSQIFTISWALEYVFFALAIALALSARRAHGHRTPAYTPNYQPEKSVQSSLPWILGIVGALTVAIAVATNWPTQTNLGWTWRDTTYLGGQVVGLLLLAAAAVTGGIAASRH